MRLQKALLIDDDVDDCYLFSLLIKEIDPLLQLTTCHECEQALACIEQTMPELIFLDIHFPRMNGFDCIKAIRDHKSFKHLPIVMYSSRVDAKNINYCYGIGASLYFEKPNLPGELRASLKKILELDWNNSYAITASHFVNGSYFPFSTEREGS